MVVMVVVGIGGGGLKLDKSCSTQWNHQSVTADSQTDKQRGLPGVRQTAIRLNVTSESRRRRPKTFTLTRPRRFRMAAVL